MAHFGVQKAKILVFAGVAALSVGAINSHSVFADNAVSSYQSSENINLDDLVAVTGSPFGTTVYVSNQKTYNLTNPGEGNWRLYSVNNDYCSAEISGNNITINGLRDTGGDSANFCRVTAISDAKKAVYSVSVRDLTEVYGSPFGDTIEVGEQKIQNLGDPGAGEWVIESIENKENCSATMSGNQITITGLKATEGDQSTFCKVTAVSGLKRARFSIKVNGEQSSDDGLTEVYGSPFGATVYVGEQMTQNLGDPGEGSWRLYSIKNGDYCSANISGNQITIAGLKDTGGESANFCKVTAVSDSKRVQFSVTVRGGLAEVYGSPFGATVYVGEQKTQNLGDPGDGTWRILSITNDDRCSASISGNVITITGLKATDGGSANFCKITAVSNAKKVRFSVSVKENEGAPLSIPVGETKTPEDLDGDPDSYDWEIVRGTDYCKLSGKGQITAIAAGGSCAVRATDGEKSTIWEVTTTTPIEVGVDESKKPEDLPDGGDNGEWTSSDPAVCTVASDGTITGKKTGSCQINLELEDGTVYTWNVTITDNPNTSDSSRVTAFTVAGATIGGLTAIFATVRRFFGRK